MSDQGIFSSPDQGTANQTPSNTQASSDTGPNLDMLVGEGRKYKTVEDLAKAYANLDGFAEQLKDENRKFKEQLAESKTVQDVLDRLARQEQQSASDQSAPKADSQSSLSASDVAAIVKRELTGMETARTRQDNLRKADAEMRRIFGDKATDVFQKEASTPEMRKALMDLAGVSPEKFVAVFHQPQQAAGSQVDSRSSTNTAAMQTTPASGRENDQGCKEFYNKLRKENPKAYYSQPVQLQMTKAAEANPNKFFGRS